MLHTYECLRCLRKSRFSSWKVRDMQRWCADMALPLTPPAEALLEWRRASSSWVACVRVRTIIGSVRVSGTQTPSTDSEVRRPLGSQEENYSIKFNLQFALWCWTRYSNGIFYKERNMLATSLPSQFKSFVAEFMDYCLGFLQYFSSLVVWLRTLLNDFLIFGTIFFVLKSIYISS